MNEICTEIVECEVCGEKLDIQSEGIDIDEEFVCEECRGEYTYICSCCEEHELESRKGNIGSVLIVNDDECGLQPGIYEIIEHPYYGGSIIGPGEIFQGAVHRLGDLPTEELDTFGYPCGHVCRYCDPIVKRRAILFRQFNL